MEMKQLRSYIAVVDYGSFTKAAEKTYTSQPTISAHIKALEEELGVQLLARDTKNLRVTEKGRELYDCACGMLALQQRMLDKWENEDRKTLCIGVSTIPSGYILPRLLEGFRSESPDVVISIRQSDSEEIEAAVEQGACDIGLVGEEAGGSLVSEPIAEDKTVLIAPNTPAFKKMIKVKDLNALLSQPMLFREKAGQGPAGRGRGRQPERPGSHQEPGRAWLRHLVHLGAGRRGPGAGRKAAPLRHGACRGKAHVLPDTEKERAIERVGREFCKIHSEIASLDRLLSCIPNNT